MSGGTNQTVTMSVRGLLVTAVGLLALVTAYLLGDAGGGPAAAQAAGQQQLAAQQQVAGAGAAGQRPLTMVGKGEATAVPEQLSFALEVNAARADLETALSVASRITKRVLGQLTAYDVRRGDVQTTGLSMYPVYDYHAYAPPTLRGYRVSQRAAVLVRDLKQAGRAVSAAVAAGGNRARVSDIRLRIGDPEAAMKRARDAAVAQATAKAGQYAAAAGQQLGDVLTLREVRSSTRSAVLDRGLAFPALRGAMDAVRPLPIRAGKDDLSVTVQVVWEFA